MLFLKGAVFRCMKYFFMHGDFGKSERKNSKKDNIKNLMFAIGI